MALGTTVAADIANAALTMYIRGKAFLQTVQNKPLIKILEAKKKTFPGGKDNISVPVQGAFMNDTAGFFTGYSEDDQLSFAQASSLLRAAYPWKEHHAGLIITESELKKDGVTVNDQMKTSDHSQAELTRLTSLLENRLNDFGESWSRAKNTLYWKDGSQDAKAMPGLLSILTDDPTAGTTGGLNRATYTWWRHRVALGIAVSEANQTLTKKLRSEVRLLKRYGGAPNTLLAGSKFLEALESEIQAKGIYTQEGFIKNASTNDIGMNDISMRGVGTFQYDPTLDDMNMEKRCYIFDDSKIQLRPMDGEDNKLRSPVRPYNYFVFLRSMTWTGGLTCQQLNCNGVYSVA